MKSALIISGQPRSAVESFENIKSTIIDHNNPDIFIHSWIDPNMFGKSYKANWLVNQGQHGNASCIVPHDIDKKIIDLYKPKSYLFEEPKIFEYHPWIEKSKSPTLPIQDAMSMLYSINAATKLKQEYEIKNQIVYDVVMRIRFGMIIRSPKIVDLKNFKGNWGTMFIPAGFEGFNRNSAFLNQISICDHWCISNTHLMNIYADTFNHVNDLVLHYDCFVQCEDLIGNWLRKINNIQVAILDYKYSINYQPQK